MEVPEMVMVRWVQERDAPEIVKLLNAIIVSGTYTAMQEILSLEDQLRFLRDFPERGVFYVAVNSDDSLVGLQDVVPFRNSKSFFHVGEISTFVDLACLRQKTGTALSRKTFVAAKNMGFVKLCAHVRADNSTGIAFYEYLGFRIAGNAQKHICINGAFVEQIVLEKFL